MDNVKIVPRTQCKDCSSVVCENPACRFWWIQNNIRKRTGPCTWLGATLARGSMKVFTKAAFRKKVVEWMVGKGQYRRKLDDLMTDITGGEDWWPEGLPDMRVNREFRGQFIKENWCEEIVRYREGYYKLAIKTVLGQCHIVTLVRISGRAHGGRRLDG